MLTVPVPSRMFFVALISEAMNIVQEVMFSASSVCVLADIGFSEAELVGEYEGLAILTQRKSPILVQCVDRHR